MATKSHFTVIIHGGIVPNFIAQAIQNAAVRANLILYSPHATASDDGWIIDFSVAKKLEASELEAILKEIQNLLRNRMKDIQTFHQKSQIELWVK